MVSHCPLEEKVFSIREQPIDFACWLGSLAQSVERQHIKLRVMGLSPAGVHFFFLFLLKFLLLFVFCFVLFIVLIFVFALFCV